jgi:NAD(P)-dependent dehydrogenase (short-subunit alcohol dehydrogenase family)
MVNRRRPAVFEFAIAEERSMPRLAGRIAFITGAGNGIGRATAILFAREGARVTVSEATPVLDWDLYHNRRDACREADRIAAQCTQGHCDELALRQARRACAAFYGRR